MFYSFDKKKNIFILARIIIFNSNVHLSSAPRTIPTERWFARLSAQIKVIKKEMRSIKTAHMYVLSSAGSQAYLRFL